MVAANVELVDDGHIVDEVERSGGRPVVDQVGQKLLHRPDKAAVRPTKTDYKFPQLGFVEEFRRMRFKMQFEFVCIYEALQLLRFKSANHLLQVCILLQKYE